MSTYKFSGLSLEEKSGILEGIVKGRRLDELQRMWKHGGGLSEHQYYEMRNLEWSKPDIERAQRALLILAQEGL